MEMNDKRKDVFENNDDQVPQFPLKIMVLSELAPRDLQTGTSSISKKHKIDKDNFKKCYRRDGS